MRNHLKGIVDDVMKRVTLKEGDVVVDIGSNDGTLLRFLPRELKRVGFEPSNVGLEQGEDGIIVAHDFFSAEAFKELED